MRRRFNPLRGVVALPGGCARLDDFIFTTAPSPLAALRIAAKRQAKEIWADVVNQAEAQAALIVRDRRVAAEQDEQQTESAYRVAEQRDSERIAAEYVRAVGAAKDAERAERQALLGKLAEQEKEIRREWPGYRKFKKRMRNHRR